MKYNDNASASLCLMWVRFRAVTLIRILEYWQTYRKRLLQKGSFSIFLTYYKKIGSFTMNTDKVLLAVNLLSQ